MEADQSKRRGRPRKAVAEHQATADGASAPAHSDSDGQGNESNPGAARKTSAVRSWQQAAARLDQVPSSVILARVTVPFEDHPALYTRLQYGAVVVTGDQFCALATDGQIINFD